MLKIPGFANNQYCDQVTRRQFLQIGGMTLGGLSLMDVLSAEAATGIRNSSKSVIVIYLPGGPAHQDTFDLKPDAPKEVRGDFKPIKTNVPGIEICELMPRMAKMMDKVSVIRSLVGCRDEHDSHLCLSGYTAAESGQLHPPTMSAVVSRIMGSADPTVPASINLSNRTQHMPYNDPGPGFVGDGYGSLKPDGPLMADMMLKGASMDRMADRRQLLKSLDRFRRKADALQGLDELQARAFGILTSSKLVQALDISKEDPKTLAMYGKGIEAIQGDASPMKNEQFLIARRLAEAGARVVTVSYGFWDYHGNNFGSLKNSLPHLDQGVSALIQDIHDRGLDKDVSVVVWGDFGRTPTINKDAGRDHWPRVSCCLLAGGGMKTGQVIGSTTPDAGEPNSRPVDYKDVFVSLYKNLGIDICDTAVPDTTGRPNYLFAGHSAVDELH